MGLDLGKIHIKRFADGEIYVQLQESVRGCDVYLIQSTCPSANENLMELLILIDACRRASAKNITAVVPYFGYARADRKASFLYLCTTVHFIGYQVCFPVLPPFCCSIRLLFQKYQRLTEMNEEYEEKGSGRKKEGGVKKKLCSVVLLNESIVK